MKKAIPTILATLLFLAVIGAYAWGIVKMISTEMSIEAMFIPFIILVVFSIIAVLLIFILIKRVKAISEEAKNEYDEY